MKKKYYDEIYFKKIMQMAEDFQLRRALNEFQKYFEVYPNDLSGKAYYVDTLIKNNDLETAEEVLVSVENYINNTTPMESKENMIMVKVKLLCIQKRYQESYDLLKNNLRIFYKRGWHYNSLMTFLREKLGILTYEDYKQGRGYLNSQILSYDEKKAIEYIKKHQNKEENEPLQFVSDFPLEKIFHDVRRTLPIKKRFNPNAFQNAYIFKYPANGYIFGRLVNYFQVITLLDSNEIIMMRPFENKGKEHFIDMVSDEIEESPKLKRVSQIEKFNHRYGNNARKEN